MKLYEEYFVPYESHSSPPKGRVLVFAPHPDDEVIGCGGALIKHVQQGDSVTPIIVSDGEAAEADASRHEAYKNERRSESYSASLFLSCNEPVFLAYPDRAIRYEEALIEQFVSLIDRFNADVVYAPSFTEMHPDHRAVCAIATEAARRVEQDVILCYYEVGRMIPSPNFLLDISDVADLHLHALDFFQSQMVLHDYKKTTRARQEFRTYTLEKRVKAAEAFYHLSSAKIKEQGLPLFLGSMAFMKEPRTAIHEPGYPLISVIIRSLGIPQLNEALNAVSLQTYPKVEVILVDASGRLAHKFADWSGRFPLRVVTRNTQLSRPKAANLGLDFVTGEWFCFLDEDDLLFPDHLYKLYHALKNEPAHMAYSNIRMIDANNRYLKDYDESFNVFRLHYGNHIPLHAALFDKKILDEGCRFDESLDILEDWDFLLQVLSLGPFTHLNRTTGLYRHLRSSGVQDDKEMIAKYRSLVLNKWKNRLSDEEYMHFIDSLSPPLWTDEGQDEGGRKNVAGETPCGKSEDDQLKLALHDMGEQMKSMDHEVRALSERMHSVQTELAAVQHQLMLTRISFHSKKKNKWLELLKKTPPFPMIRHAKQGRIIRKSGLFDRDYYLSRYPDVRDEGLEPITHYVLHGAREGRNPSPRFSTLTYLQHYPDVRQSDLNPLVHYIQYGRQEGRFSFPEEQDLADNTETVEASEKVKRSDHGPSIGKVLMVSGEPHTPGHHYRILPYQQTFSALLGETEWLSPDKTENVINDLDGLQLLFIWRSDYNLRLSQLIKTARDKGVPVIYDIDDYMFSPLPETIQQIDGIRSMGISESIVRAHYKRLAQALSEADFNTAPTDFLAGLLKNNGKEAGLLPNTYTLQKYNLSQDLCVNKKRDEKLLRVGYAGGTKTHQKDFKVASEALAEILHRHPQVQLVVFGEALDLDEFPELAPFYSRIERRKLVSPVALQQEIARFDINLAPLEINDFCEAKSELKYFEAALLEIPTIASPTSPFKNVIEHGMNGFLAANTQEWIQSLEMLIQDEAVRTRCGKLASTHVLWNFSPEQRIHATFKFLSDTNLCKKLNISHKSLWRMAHDHMLNESSILPSKTNMWPVIAPHRVVRHHSSGKVSEAGVIIPLHNYEEYILDALDSVRDQSIKELDLVVVDDCSTDDSLKIVLNWMEKNHRRFNQAAILQNTYNSKLGATRNVAYSHIRSRYVMQLDADNYLLPDCVETCLNHIKNSVACMVFPQVRRVRRAKKTKEVILDAPLNMGDWNVARLATGNYIDAMTMVSKAAWAKVGGFSTDFQMQGWEDYDMWLKFVEHGLFGINIPWELAAYRVHDKAMMSNENDASLLERRREIIEKHPWIKKLADE